MYPEGMVLGIVAIPEGRQTTGHKEVQQTTSGGHPSRTEHRAMRSWKKQDGGDAASGQGRESLEADYRGRGKASGSTELSLLLAREYKFRVVAQV